MPDWLSNTLEYVLDFSNVLNASISASWLILIVIALRFLMKKAPKWVNVALWGIVALRLLMPFSIESAFSLIPSAQTVSDQLMQAETMAGQQSAYLDIVTNPAYGGSVSVELETTISAFQWELVDLTFLWVAGIAVMALYTAVTYWRLWKKVATAVILQENIFCSEYVSSPFVLGILKPRIYLPYAMEVEDMEHVIAHEHAHIRRKDHWWKPLGFLLLTIHWFNPLMWAAYLLLCRDIELACDEKVISELDSIQRADYSQALVSCSVSRRSIAACPLAFGEVGVKERVRSIMNYRRPTFWIIVTALIVCVAVAVCFLTDPKEISTPEPIMDALSSEEVEWAQVTLWENATEHISLNEAQIQELIRILNNLDESDFVHSKVPEHNLSLMIYCGPSKEILLHWDGDYTWFTFHSEMLKGIDADYCYVNSQTLSLFFSQFYEKTILYAKLLALEDEHFIVEPITASPELNSASRIMVPMRNMAPSPEPVVGDILQIEYDGMLQETYPARITNVYRISVAEQAAPIKMVPTDTKLEGLAAGALLLPMDGHTYRYLLTDSTPENATADELLYRFQEIDMEEQVLNEVYSLKEYPDRSKVLLISGKNGPWLCEYSPPQRCSDTALADAIEAGYVVIEDGIATHGQEIWHEFYDQTQKGNEASVTVAQHHTLNPDRCDFVYYEIFKQDYPCLYVHELRYDGKQFTLSNGAEGTRTYEYLMKYEDGPKYAFRSVVPQYRYQYVLTHDNRYTYNQLWMSIASSQVGAYIDHYTIYSEPKP